ncbi:BCCT family transporter [Brevibacterium sp. LS14]|nr:BCCT family transporter [Brevibacterium casei]MCT2358708.1 BCCT family transporter [Brevibacterium casei]NJE66956.1 BCCT family transporter [Brevibacterium sp. LS14]
MQYESGQSDAEDSASRPQHRHAQLPGHGMDFPGGISPAMAEANALRHRPGSVFWISIAGVAAFTLWGVLSPDGMATTMTNAMNSVAASVGWTYLIVPLGCIGLLLYLGFGRFGRVRLGAEDDRPEFSTWAWLAMILSAVMGIGLISYGVAEPISHFTTPPHDLAAPGTTEAAVVALQYSYFDWGPHAWAVFGVFGLAIAYSTHKRGNTGLISPMLRPLFGKAMGGWLGKLVDIMAVVATLFGTTTSLGLGASQISEGLNRVFGIPNELFVQIIIILGITVVFTLSALSGVNKGIKFLSQTTAVLSIFLGLFVLIVGPTGFIGNLFFRATGQYLGEFFTMSLLTPLTSDAVGWYQYWTYFMMAWWLSWGAFVGVFLAKISKGRTVRQFVLGVMGVPSLVFFAWFTVFGGTAIKIDMDGGGQIGKAAAENVNSAFFETLGNLPWTGLTSVIAIILVVLYFVSGADANTFVLSMLTSRGTLEPSRWVLTVWGVLTGTTAMVLFFAGGLAALQQAAMLSALPFAIIVALLGICIVKTLHEDHSMDAYRTVRRKDLPEEFATTEV